MKMSTLKELLPWSSRGHEMLSFTDRLNGRYSVVFLLVIGSIVGLSQMWGDYPIACTTPAHFEPSMVNYAHKACWVSSSLYIPFSGAIPKHSEGHEIKEAGFRVFAKLHWIFLLQAFLFYLPVALWEVVRHNPFIPLRTLGDAGTDYLHAKDADTQDRAGKFLGRRLGHFLWDVKSNVVTQIFTLWGHYLSLSYLLIRLLYIVVVFINLSVVLRMLGRLNINTVLSFDRNMTMSDIELPSPYFPRIVLCDFVVRVLGNVQRYTVQCVFHKNELLQNIVMFAGCWFVFVAVVNVWSFIEYFVTALFIPCCKGGVDAILTSLNKHTDNISDFTSFLGRDGAFIARLVGYASSDLVSAEMIGGAFEFYNERTAGGAGGNLSTGGLVVAPHPQPHGGAAIPMQNVPSSSAQEKEGVYPNLA